MYDAQRLVYTDRYSTRYEQHGSDRRRQDLLMPSSPAVRVLMYFWRILAMILIGLVATVWCASMILRVGVRMRDPLNIVNLILGIASLRKARSPVEKVLFVARC